MIFERKYPAGVAVPGTIRCPHEILQVERDDRTARVTTDRASSIRTLKALGFSQVAEVADNKDTPLGETAPEVPTEEAEAPPESVVAKPKKRRAKV